MTIPLIKGLALAGLCAVLASAGSAASAQGFSDGYGGPMHHHHHHARYAIMRQKAAYYHAVEHGNYAAAERAHMRARMIRHHIRARHVLYGDHGY